MLSEQEKTKITEAMARYPQARAAVADALTLVQRTRGWVSDESIKDVAAVLGMSAEEVDEVATFFTMIFRKPVGRHVILLCDSVSCWITGSDGLLEHLTRRLGVTFGQTTADGRFTLLPVACLGVCEKAPAMMVDKDLHVQLTPERLELALAKYE